MNQELKVICVVMSAFILVMGFILAESLYSIKTKASCKEIALNNKYEYKEIELICK